MQEPTRAKDSNKTKKQPGPGPHGSGRQFRTAAGSLMPPSLHRAGSDRTALGLQLPPACTASARRRRQPARLGSASWQLKRMRLLPSVAVTIIAATSRLEVMTGASVSPQPLTALQAARRQGAAASPRRFRFPRSGRSDKQLPDVARADRRAARKALPSQPFRRSARWPDGRGAARVSESACRLSLAIVPGPCRRPQRSSCKPAV